MPKRLKRLRILEGSLVDNPANIGAQLVLWKRHDPAADDPDDNDPETEIMPTKQDELFDDLDEQVGTLTKANADLEARAVAAEAKLAKAEAEAAKAKAEAEIAKQATPPPKPPEAEELTKGMTFEQREAFESLRKQTEDNAQVIAKMRDEAEERDAIRKVEKSWPTLPVKAADFGPVYRKIAKALADDADGLAVIEKILGSYGQMAEIATSSVGRAAIYGVGDAETQAEAQAKQLRQAHPSLSADQAIVKVYEQNPELYTQYLRERQ